MRGSLWQAEPALSADAPAWYVERIMKALSDIVSLEVPERLRLLEEIWDSLADHPESVPVTDAQRRELDRRMSRHDRNPHSASSWKEVRKRLTKK